MPRIATSSRSVPYKIWQGAFRPSIVLYRKDEKADLLVKVYISFFANSITLFKEKKVDRQTF